MQTYSCKIDICSFYGFDLFCRSVKADMTSFITMVKGIFAEIEILYQRIAAVKEKLDEIGIDFGILPSLSLPSINFPSIELGWSLPSSEEIAQKLQNHFESLAQSMNQLVYHTQENAMLVSAKVEAFTDRIESVFDDYAPPSVNTSLLWSEFETNQTTFIQDLWNSVLNTSQTSSM